MTLNISLAQIPIKALSDASREVLCRELNRMMIARTDNETIRDYRGLGELMHFEYSAIQQARETGNPTKELLRLWEEKEGSTIGKLMDFLEQMERFDVLDDVEDSLLRGGRGYLRHMTTLEEHSPATRELEAKAKDEFELEYITRPSWGAFRAVRETPLVISPVRIVFIHHSVYLKDDIAVTVQNLQSSKIVYYGHDDVCYNFMVANDGTVFEGRGWDLAGSHTRSYNYFTLSIGLLGNFDEMEPDQRLLDAIQLLIDFGVNLGKIHPDYGIYAHCDASVTLSPGKHALEKLKDFPRFHHFGTLPVFSDLQEMTDEEAKRLIRQRAIEVQVEEDDDSDEEIESDKHEELVQAMNAINLRQSIIGHGQNL